MSALTLTAAAKSATDTQVEEEKKKTETERQKNGIIVYILNGVTRKKSPNLYKSCPKMISLEKW